MIGEFFRKDFEERKLGRKIY